MKHTTTHTMTRQQDAAEKDNVIIHVHELEKTYTTYKRKERFIDAVKSLFRRERVTTHAVKKISFDINKGEIIGLVGPNGAGKSTAIKAMTGILYPTSGTVNILGYTPWKQRTKYVANIGAVFGQKSQLWWDLPPLDSFHLLKHIYSIPETPFRKRLSAMTKLLGVEQLAQRPTRNLSLGERMKCEFIAALLHNPPLLFLDEPTIGLDAIAKEDIRSFLTRINKEERTTIILTTHDMDDIEELCSRIIIIDEGSIIYDGPLKELKEKYIKWKTVSFEHGTVKNEKAFHSALKKGRLRVNKEKYKVVRYNKHKVDIPAMIATLMKSCEIVDLTIDEPRLEDVMKEIYTKT